MVVGNLLQGAAFFGSLKLVSQMHFLHTLHLMAGAEDKSKVTRGLFAVLMCSAMLTVVLSSFVCQVSFKRCDCR